MDPTNVQNFRKNSNVNKLQLFAFALQIVCNNFKDKSEQTPISSNNVRGIPLTISRTNLNEEAYCHFLLISIVTLVNNPKSNLIQ